LGEDSFRVEAGVSCARFARYAARQRNLGLEFLTGVPGTIGGALAMNAGAHGGETWQFITAVETIDNEGVIRTRLPKDFKISYRHVERPKKEWFVAGHFKCHKGDPEEGKERIRKLLEHRSRTQPTGDYSCGSVFRNPSNDYAARLIEASGLKGYHHGGAQVSEKHANFIINSKNATAQDIEELINHVRQQVLIKHNVNLIPEVHIIGDMLQ